jgi:tetratricopeptide (TPR) repeat protein
LVTLLVFVRAGGFDFLDYDDTDYVTDNPVVQEGLTLPGLRWAFLGYHAANWHPVTWLSHMLDCGLFGLNPGPQHFVNVLFHSANTALLFLLVWRLTRRWWPAALVAALFGWHPLRVESVAWIAERKDVLSLFFALLALHCYAQYAAEAQKRPGRRRLAYVSALACFALGLMSKPMLVTLPFVLLLLDYWPLGRIPGAAPWRRVVVEKIPFFALSAAACVATVWAQKAGEAMVTLEHIPLSLRLENAPVAVADYLGKTFWPAKLCVIYPMPEAISAWKWAAAAGLLAAITGAAWRWRKASPYFIMGWLWFLGTLVPVIGLVEVGGQSMADRYSYLPSVGLLVALVFGGERLLERVAAGTGLRVGLAGMALAGCVAVTEYQLQFWRDSETLFRRATAVTQNNTIAWINLGVALESQERWEEALNAYEQAKRTGHPRHEIYNDLGLVLSHLDRHAESLAAYEEGIRLRPDNAILHLSAGGEQAALGHLEGALAEFATAESLDPQAAAPHLEAATALFQAGRDAEGVSELRIATRLARKNFRTLAVAAHYLAANQDAAARDGQTALSLALAADQLSGHAQPMVLDILGMAYAETGDFTNAVACAQDAVNVAESSRQKTAEGIRRRLALYEQGQPWRESFEGAGGAKPR